MSCKIVEKLAEKRNEKSKSKLFAPNEADIKTEMNSDNVPAKLIDYILRNLVVDVKQL